LRSRRLEAPTLRFLLAETRLDDMWIETVLAILWTDVLALGIIDADAQYEVVLCEPPLSLLL
jgi:hypothetical protein